MNHTPLRGQINHAEVLYCDPNQAQYRQYEETTTTTTTTTSTAGTPTMRSNSELHGEQAQYTAPEDTSGIIQEGNYQKITTANYQHQLETSIFANSTSSLPANESGQMYQADETSYQGPNLTHVVQQQNQQMFPLEYVVTRQPISGGSQPALVDTYGASSTMEQTHMPIQEPMYSQYQEAFCIGHRSILNSGDEINIYEPNSIGVGGYSMSMNQNQAQAAAYEHQLPILDRPHQPGVYNQHQQDQQALYYIPASVEQEVGQPLVHMDQPESSAATNMSTIWSQPYSDVQQLPSLLDPLPPPPPPQPLQQQQQQLHTQHQNQHQLQDQHRNVNTLQAGSSDMSTNALVTTTNDSSKLNLASYGAHGCLTYQPQYTMRSFPPMATSQHSRPIDMMADISLLQSHSVRQHQQRPMSPSKKQTLSQLAASSVPSSSIECLQHSSSDCSSASRRRKLQEQFLDMKSSGSISQEWLDNICRHLNEHMNRFGICVIDNFLGSIKGGLILDEVTQLFESGQYSKGKLVSDMREGSGVIRNDRVIWIDGCENGCTEINNLIQTLCSVITNSSRLALYSNKGLDKVVINKRTKAHITCYPGNGTRYIKHVDNPNGDGRVITSIYYLNKCWNSKRDGGLLRMFPAGMNEIANIEPLFDRALFFWSDRRNPHEVLPAHRNRFAITVWYIGENRPQ